MATGPAQPTHLLDNGPIATFVDDLGRLLAAMTWSKPAESGLGLTVTRAAPQPINPLGFEMPRASESVALRLLFGAAGLDVDERSVFPALGDVFCLTSGGTPSRPCRGRMPFQHGAGIAPAQATVTDILVASGAFPFAFAPAQVTVYLPGGHTESAMLLDGGILNNNPVQLVHLVGGVGPADMAAHASETLYLDVDTGVPTGGGGGGAVRSLVDVVGALGTAMMTAGASGHLNAFAETLAVPASMPAPPRSSPLAGEHVFALSGFFAFEFRVHDFFRGMEDAVAFLGMPAGSLPPHAERCLLELQSGVVAPSLNNANCGTKPEIWDQVIRVAQVTSVLGRKSNYWAASLSARWEAFLDALDGVGFEARYAGMFQGQDPSHYNQLLRVSLQERLAGAVDASHHGRISRGVLNRGADAVLDDQFGVMRARWQLGVTLRSGTRYGGLEPAARVNVFRYLSGLHGFLESGVLLRAGAVSGATLSLSPTFAVGVGHSVAAGVDVALVAGATLLDAVSYVPETARSPRALFVPVDVRVQLLKKWHLSLGRAFRAWVADDSASLGTPTASPSALATGRSRCVSERCRCTGRSGSMLARCRALAGARESSAGPRPHQEENTVCQAGWKAAPLTLQAQ